MRSGVIAVGASDGATLWHDEAPANGTANCSALLRAAPRLRGRLRGPGLRHRRGRALASRKGDTFEAAEEHVDKKVPNRHGGRVLVGGYVYGTSGARRCIEFKTGRVMWEGKTGKGAVARADGRLYARNEGGKGTVGLVEANPKAYTEKGPFDQPDRSKGQNSEAWAHPVIANGTLHLRDQGVLLCCEVRAKWAPGRGPR